tara:strand:- start:191 stop:622 length:432 start_codon:yes stop_codon:yes gene_type:complete
MSNRISNEWSRKSTSSGKVYHVCKMEWNQPADDNNDDEIISPPFNWTVDSDFVTFVNYKAVDTSTSHDVVMHIYGSINTVNKADMLTAVTIANANFDGKVYKHFYDVSSNGIAPLMFISLDPADDIGAVDIDIAIYPNIRRPE